ncbi:hypothetical protein FA10DRAFT_265219 [Acaromyces ingoldii]|uniref:Mid2 domain-containing protein n=1 Tax=Acaromyces ingoldii TaxID=215250 RepID=A0A316YPP9_9BASI|nr:hypothetical protein FA10DRAFT_265219 [Acaromyces ingoldii]PWN91357.1 hypothetical protein FA10DRAFT_265219 [Acaromyces ingoldii]
MAGATLRSSLLWSLCFVILVLGSYVRSAGINVDVPEDFYQCQPAVIGITGARGNVTIIVKESHSRHAHLNVSLAPNATQYTWAAVDLTAGTDFALIITDRTSKNKTKLSQNIQHSTVDLPPTGVNDTSCLPVKKVKSSSDGDKNKDDGGGIGGIGGDPSLEDDPGHHRKHSTVEVSVIAGVLGGLLFALMLLILVMCLRRRRENLGASDDSDSFIQQQQQMSQRIGSSALGTGNRASDYVTLADGTRRRIDSIVMARQDDSGWSYMSSLVPGLQAAEGARGHHRLQSQQQQQRRALRTKRYDGEAADCELPSYGLSEYERKHLPKYEGRDEGGDDAGHETDELVARESHAGTDGLDRSSTMQSGVTRTTRQTYYSRASSSGAPFIYDLDQPSGESRTPSGVESDVGLAYLGGEEDPDVITFHATPSAHTLGPNSGAQSRTVSIIGVPPQDQQPRSILTRNLAVSPFADVPEDGQASPATSTALDPSNGRIHHRNRSEVNPFDWDRPSS